MNDERKSPETTPEATGDRWLKLDEAAMVLGLTERQAREWVRARALPVTAERPARIAESTLLAAMRQAGKSPRPLPEVSPEIAGDAPEVPPEIAGSYREPIEATYTTTAENHSPPVALVPLAAVADQLQGLADRLADMALEVGQLRERTTTQATTIGRLEAERAELRRRAEAAEAERDELRRQAAPAPPNEATTITTPAVTPAPPAPAGGFWRRVRELFAGE